MKQSNAKRQAKYRSRLRATEIQLILKQITKLENRLCRLINTQQKRIKNHGK